ncbi:MAG: hypothetical protein JWO52_7515 [Gammaproteobacteria bacterium]|nr:hypothetical protein [Gammaproteobacteria bacterium]
MAMTKSVVLSHLLERARVAEFNRWYVEEFATQLVLRIDNITGLIVKVADPAAASEAANGSLQSPDVITEVWTAGALGSLRDLEVAGCATHAYQVDEFVEKNEVADVTGLIPGVDILATLYPRRELRGQTIRELWDAHVPLALKIHFGMNVYARDWVVRKLTEDSPDIFGIATLHFPSRDALKNQFFRSPADVDVHKADLDQFVAAFSPVTAEKYVIKRVAGWPR